MYLIKSIFLYAALLPTILVATPIINFLVYTILGITSGWKEAFCETRDTYRAIVEEYKDRWLF